MDLPSLVWHTRGDDTCNLNHSTNAGTRSVLDKIGRKWEVLRGNWANEGRGGLLAYRHKKNPQVYKRLCLGEADKPNRESRFRT